MTPVVREEMSLIHAVRFTRKWLFIADENGIAGVQSDDFLIFKIDARDAVARCGKDK